MRSGEIWDSHEYMTPSKSSIAVLLYPTEGNRNHHYPSQVPTDEPMPTDRASLPKIYIPWLAGCTIDNFSEPAPPTVTLWLNGRPISALLDLGSAITLAYPSALPYPVESKGSLAVTSVHGDVREVPTTEVQVDNRRSEWPQTIGLVPDLSVS